MSSDGALPVPIAIIGMGLRLPGGISTPDEFWELMVTKRDGRCHVPTDRYNVDSFYGKKMHNQKVATEYGYFLDDVNIKAFDASFFGAKRIEVESCDPQQRLLLEVVWECMESAGQKGLRGTNTGVFVGVFGEDWHNILHMDTQSSSPYRAFSAADYALSNRLSYEYDFRGPSMTIRTACSASMSSLHLACQALRNGDCSTAIVAGTSLILEPSMTLDMSGQGVLSPTGSCKTFDASADGFARGEAINAILIKPLDDAIRDGDPVRGVIRGLAVNSDGKTSTFGSPSTEAQIQLIRRAYEAAGIEEITQTPFVECHGTGTPVGDPLEAAAVGAVFDGYDTYIGSVKPNVGHAEGASGLSSVIKAVLALEHDVIPPNIGFSKPNPKIPFEEKGLRVPTEAVPWPKDRPARVSVNCFGIGGANAHAIIDSAASFGLSSRLFCNKQSKPEKSAGPLGFKRKDTITDGAEKSPGNPTEEPKLNGTGRSINIGSATDDLSNGDNHAANHEETVENFVESDQDADVGGAANGKIQTLPNLLLVTASTETSLQTRIENLREYIEYRPTSVPDVAHTLALHRIHLPYRSFCISPDDVKFPLEFSDSQKILSSPTKKAKIAFVFTGQGAQWTGMGRALLELVPSFLDDIRKMDSTLQELEDPPNWRMEEIMFSDDENTDGDLLAAEFSQPLCTAIQLGLVDFLSKCGVVPGVVIGHSSGEIAAAYAAGGMTMEESIVCAYLRGIATKGQHRAGAMAVIGAGRDEISNHLQKGTELACDNSPKSVTISGDAAAVDKTLEMIKAGDPEIFTRKLNVSIAYHSEHMRDIGTAYKTSLESHLSGGVPKKAFYSTVSGKAASADTRFNATYWKSNLESPVLFHDAMKKLLQDTPDLTNILEIGPHAALQGPIRQIQQACALNKPPKYIPTLVRNKDCAISILRTLGQLWSFGYEVDLSYVNPKAFVLTDLPNYPWDHSKEYWQETRISEAWRFKKHPRHELLGSRCLESNDSEPSWRNVLHHSDTTWLADHMVGSNVVLPGAAYIAMMGEAIRQILRSDSYVLRNLMVKSALVLAADAVEIMTSMRPSRLTSLTNSSWYDLAISTFNGTHWVENCIAQGKAGEEGRGKLDRPLTPCPRRVPKTYFYEQIQRLGLKYGPRFQGLDNISVHTKEKRATATIRNDESMCESAYALHPTTIDFCFQLCAVAGSNGISRHLNTLELPFDIRQISINPCNSDLVAEVLLNAQGTGGSAVAVAKDSNDIVLAIENGRGVPFDTGDEQIHQNALHAARIEWRPDIDCLDMDGLVKPRVVSHDHPIALERLSIAAMLQTMDIIMALGKPIPYKLANYVSWLESEKADIVQGRGSAMAPEAQEWAQMDIESRQTLLTSLLHNVQDLGAPTASNYGHAIYEVAQWNTLDGMLMEKVQPMEILFVDNRLAGVYQFSVEKLDIASFFSICGHSKPTLKILEVGAGTGAIAEVILSAMRSKSGIRMFSEYVFTDISSGFFLPAKEKFKDFSGIDYRVLDIEKDPTEQGFEAKSFDIVVASNVLHATSSLRNSLRNVHSLLRPGGRLFLHELVDPSPWKQLNFVMGLLPGWWNGVDEGRSSAPFVSVERWDKELRDAGFTGTDVAVLDDDPMYTLCAGMVSTVPIPAHKSKLVTFLYLDQKPEFACKLAEEMEMSGTTVGWTQFHNYSPDLADCDIISTFDLEAPFLKNISESDYNKLRDLLCSLKCGLLWLTRPAQISCIDPSYGLILGVSRTIRVEMSITLWTVEIQRLDAEAVVPVASVCRKFANRSRADGVLDSEYSVHENTVRVGRYHWTDLSTELELELQDDDPKQLVIGQYGLMDSLHWLQHKNQSVLQPNEVEVQIDYVGLNFKDIMMTMGIVQGRKDAIGLEAVGLITRVGHAVGSFQVGDRVLVANAGLVATRKAVTMPVVYMTVIYAIISVGKLEKGQSILIHSACGGVGQAAIHLCQSLGAEIYVTVGNEEKVQYLIDNHKIPRERIFNSHSTSFLDDIMEATAGKGVNLVLNSLSGDLLHASWKCVARLGKMLEIGKRDILERGSLGMDMFQHNRSFHGIDLEEIMRDFPDIVKGLLDQFSRLAAKGYLKPIRPIHVYQADNIPEAFRFMKKGQHIGKIVIKMPDSAADIVTKKPLKPALFSEVSTYLMVGGLGGIGRAVATWMVEGGARNFIFLSRSAGKSEEDRIFLRELEFQGCHAAAVAGSVAEVADVQRAIEAAPTTIGGVLQMSMVLKDRSFQDMSHSDWRSVQDPKVKGTWNLHEALGGNLEFFVLISSLTGTVGHPGQTNYASANTFLDSFVQYRHSLGMPCSAIDLGGMEDIGFLSTEPQKMRQYRNSGLFMLKEKHLMEAIQISIEQNRPSTSSGPISSLDAGDPRIAVYNNMGTVASAAYELKNRGLNELLAEIEANPDMLHELDVIEKVAWEIGRTLFEFLVLPEEDLNIDMTLQSIGIDSLAAIEIRNWWRRTLGMDVTVLEIMNAVTIIGLGKLAISRLQEKYGVKRDAEGDARVADGDTLVAFD